MITIGSLLFLAGLVLFWLPLPVGLPLMLLGGPILIRHSPRARGWWQRHRHRVPFAVKQRAP
jgi:hypothetical protein